MDDIKTFNDWNTQSRDSKLSRMQNVTNNEEAVVKSRRSRWRRVMRPWIRTWLQQHLKIGLEPQAQHRKEGSYPGSQFLNLSFLGKGWVSCQTWRWFFSWTATLLRGFWSGLSSRETVCFPVQLHVRTSPRHVNKVFATWFPSKLKLETSRGRHSFEFLASSVECLTLPTGHPVVTIKNCFRVRD